MFIGREAVEALEPLGEVVGSHKLGEVHAQCIMAIGMEALDGCFPYGAVDGDEQIEPSFCRRHLSDIDVEEANGISFEALQAAVQA